MKEVGIITKLNGEYVYVKVDKKDECSKCGMCAFPKNANSIEIFARNNVNAKKDEQVIVEIKDKGKMLGFLLVFIVPLLLLCGAILLNFLLVHNELLTMGIGIVLIALWYFVLSFIDKYLKKSNKYGAEVVAVINKKN